MNDIQLKNIALKSIVLLAVLIVFLLIWLIAEPSAPVLVGIILSSIIIVCFLRPKLPIILLLLSIMFTEFYWMEVMGGYLKPFHLASVIMFFTFTVFYLEFLKLSRIFWLFILFVLICLVSIAFSGDRQDSLRSFILPIMLFSIAINSGMALFSQKINEETFGKIILYGSFITVLFGLIQMLLYSSAGYLLKFTEVQNSQIIIGKRPPSFFTEADTFGKFLSLPFFFLFRLRSIKKLNTTIK